MLDIHPKMLWIVPKIFSSCQREKSKYATKREEFKMYMIVHACIHLVTSNILPLIWGISTCRNVHLSSFFTHSTPQVFVDLGSEDPKWVNHAYISTVANCQSHFGIWLLYLLAAAPVFVQRHHLSAAYLFISLTVYPDKIKKSENVAL